ncbi:hypothetical protein SynMINOS11_01914 [Synechococcus sp. Minos11]|nr:hypothetical protein SynMINOS11_01914 [Synechococcus sp. Minos11]
MPGHGLELHGFAAVQVGHKQQQDTKGDEGFHRLFGGSL